MVGNDGTAAMKIQVWNEQSQYIQTHTKKKNHTITNLTRHFAGQCLLTTTQHSTLTECKDITIYNENIDVDQNIKTLMGQAVAVDIKFKLRCIICKKHQMGNFNSTDKYHRCDHCERKQEISTYEKTKWHTDIKRNCGCNEGLQKTKTHLPYDEGSSFTCARLLCSILCCRG